MAELESVVSEDHRRPETTTRTLSLCLDDVSQVVHLPRLAAAFRDRMPRASLAIVSVDTLISNGGLEGGAADAAVAPAQAVTGYASLPLFEVEAVLAVRRGHPCLRKRDRVAAINQLRHVDVHLALGGGGVGHGVAEQALSHAGVQRDVAMVVPSFTAAAMVAAASDLVAGVPRSLVGAIARTAPLTVLEVPSGGLRMQMHLMWHERTADDPICAAFRELVVEALSDLRRRS